MTRVGSSFFPGLVATAVLAAKTVHLLPDDILHGVDLWSEVSPEVFAFIVKYSG
jgi:hypothetical protein